MAQSTLLTTSTVYTLVCCNKKLLPWWNCGTQYCYGLMSHSTHLGYFWDGGAASAGNDYSRSQRWGYLHRTLWILWNFITGMMERNICGQIPGTTSTSIFYAPPCRMSGLLRIELMIMLQTVYLLDWITAMVINDGQTIHHRLLLCDAVSLRP